MYVPDLTLLLIIKFLLNVSYHVCGTMHFSTEDRLVERARHEREMRSRTHHSKEREGRKEFVPSIQLYFVGAPSGRQLDDSSPKTGPPNENWDSLEFFAELMSMTLGALGHWERWEPLFTMANDVPSIPHGFYKDINNCSINKSDGVGDSDHDHSDISG